MSRPDHGPPLPVGKLPGALLERLIGRYGTTDPDVLVGPGLGRDAAAIAFGERALVVKSDPITFATTRAATYLVDVNANDLACLGARPRWMLVTSLLPAGKTTAEDVEEHFRELQAVCEARGIAVVGGHCEVTIGLDRPILVGTLFGDVATDRLLRPGGARPGDRLLLTKALAIEGTALLAREAGARLRPLLGDALVERAAYLLTEPGISVVADARLLLSVGGVTALHDPTEGGLATGVRELAGAAGHTAVLERDALPVLPETAAIAGVLGLDPLGLLASGSLLASVAPDPTDHLVAAGRAAGLPVTSIGEVTAAHLGFRMVADGRATPLPEFASDEVTRVL